VKISSWARRATSSALVVLASCGGSKEAKLDAPRAISTSEARVAVDFAFDSLDERPVSAEATRGKPTVIAFVNTGSLPAQAQVDFLVVMAKHDAANPEGDAVNYAIVALESRENRELVELYRKSLGIPFPVAMADEATAAGAGPFGDVTAVPVTVILDRTGRVVWRVAGRVAKADEIRVALKGI
jgi:hypothetical protein